jgi:hypothetical protein
MLKLGTIVTDNVTGTKGMLTLLNIDMGDNVNYSFQPSALNPETQVPVDTFWITGNRVVGGEECKHDLPMKVLGTQVKDKATGFSGTAISLYLHLNGCIHVDVKPKGTLKKTGESVAAQNFDLRRLEGAAVPVLTEKQLEKSKKETPSPERMPATRKT